MKSPARMGLSLLPRAVGRCSVHSSPAQAANVVPIVGTGPPPEPPTPAARPVNDRIERRKRHVELLKVARVTRSAPDGKTTTLSKRFWRDVSVQEVNGESARVDPSLPGFLRRC